MRQKIGFTLSEVLITLVVIGVIAAIAVPLIYANYQKKVYVVQLKKSYKTVVSGFRSLMAKEGVLRISETSLWQNKDDEGALQSEMAQAFIILKQYGVGKARGDDAVNYKCLNMNSINGSIHNWSPTFLNDGSILYYSFRNDPYYPQYRPDENKPADLGNIWIDVNGIKPPNKIGRDLFQFVLYDDGSLHGMASRYYWKWDQGRHFWKTSTNSQFNCSTKASSCGVGCAGRIMEENWEMRY